MPDVLLQINSETLNQAVSHLSAKISDLAEGSSLAERHFEKVIGSDATPDLSRDERIARLDSIRQELQRLIAFVESEDEEAEIPGSLSDHALVVLTDIAGDQEPPRLIGPHVLVGKGMPSAHLYRATSIARARMSILLIALNDMNEPEPDHTYLDFFHAYEEVIEEEGVEMEDDLSICHAAIGYLTEIYDNLEAAWTDGIAIPECLFDHVLQPLLDAASSSKLH